LANNSPNLNTSNKKSDLVPPSISLEGLTFDSEALEKISAGLAYRHKVFPVRLEENILTVAMADPHDVILIDEIRLVSDCEVEPIFSDEDDIESAIIEAYGKTAGAILNEGIRGPAGTVSTIERQTIGDFGISEQDLLQDPTVVNAVDQMIIDAVRAGASDIHIEPFPGEVKVRYRVDGVLEEQAPPPSQLQWAITGVVKIMADLDVAERRVPQDGKIAKEILSLGNRQIDLRVSTVPTIHGESVVLRILDRQSISFGLKELGMMDDNFDQFHTMIRNPHGIILATGPTGSGKTTTLYACLREINIPEVKIITVEDPVEYELEGINQMQVNPAIDVTFASGLRHILRQDPDKVLIGEIRDYETAEMAIHTSLTGHLVFSSLHTNDAPSAVTRLIDMKVEPYLIASTLEGVVAQRLARRVCSYCNEMYRPSVETAQEMTGDPNTDISPDLMIPRAVGCKECNGRGYKGRIGLFEVFTMNEEIRDLTLEHASSSQLRRAAFRAGMRSLREDGWHKVQSGYTTIEEVLRLTQEDELIMEGNS